MDNNEQSLKEVISKVKKVQKQLGEISADIVGRIDNKTLMQYNALVKDTENFLGRLTFLASNEKAKSHQLTSDNECIPLWLLEKRKDVPKSAINALSYAGFHTTKDLTYVKLTQLEKVDRIGTKALSDLITFCNKVGITIGSSSDNAPEFSKGDIIITTVEKRFPMRDKYYPQGIRAAVVEKTLRARRKGTFALYNYKCIPTDSDDPTDYLMLSPSEMRME